MNEAPANATVLNTTVISNFAQIDCVELVANLPRVVTVPAVKTELEAGVETHQYLAPALAVLEQQVPVVDPTETAHDLERDLLDVLDPGEAQALAVAEAVDGTIVTDDGDARSIANQRGISLTGSIGLLVRFVEAEQLSSATADAYLKRWIDDAGFHSPARDFDTFLED